MKTIGILGGATSESTLMYYKYITEGYIKKYNDYGYPKILINSVSFEKFFQCFKTNDFTKLNELIAEEGAVLERAGADFIMIACNTFHLFIDKLMNEIKIPFLNIVDSVKREIIKDKAKKVVLLGTKHTMDFNMYGEELIKNGIEVITPEEKDKETINEIIYEELPKGIIKEESKIKALNIIDKLKKRDIEGVILGCTELPLLIKNEDTPLKIYDSTYIHSIDALNLSLEI